MTGGQMSPTTLMGQKTATCPYGREPELHGYNLNITELAGRLKGTCYVLVRVLTPLLQSIKQSVQFARRLKQVCKEREAR